MQLAILRRTAMTGLVVATTVVSACRDVTSPDPIDGSSPILEYSKHKKRNPPPPPPAPPSSTNPLASLALYVNPSSDAKRTADSWRTTRPADALQMDKIAGQPQARWLGDWNADIRADVDRAVSTATAANAVAVLVAYNIPQRDCGSYSSGGSNTPQGYRDWITAFAAGIGALQAVVILEPDALAGMDCLSSTDQQTRMQLLAFAVNTLRAQGLTSV